MEPKGPLFSCARICVKVDLDKEAGRVEGDVAATKSLKASYKILRHSPGLKSRGGSIPEDFKTGSDDPYFDHDTNLINNSNCVKLPNPQLAGISPHRSLIIGLIT